MNPQIGFLLSKSLEALKVSNLDSAELFLNQALRMQPSNSVTLRLLGVISSQRRDYVKALNYLNTAIKNAPRDFLLFSNLGNVLYEMKNYPASLEAYDRSIKLNPKYEEVWTNKGNLLRAWEKLEEALFCHEKAINLRPGYAEAWNNKANVLNDLGKKEDALDHYTKAISLNQEYEEAWNNRGNTLRDLGRCEEALENHDKALTLNNNNPIFWVSKGLTLHEMGRYKQAIDHYDEALSLEINLTEAYANKGLAFHEIGRYNEAIEQYKLALTLKPELYEVWKNKGVTFHDLAKYEDALQCYEKALALKPESVETKWNKSLALLIKGEFNKGLPLYENRWYSQKISSAQDHRFIEYSKWTGHDNLLNKTILVYGEQGYGDFIQFCRYVKLLPELGAKVILETPDPLVELMQTLDDRIEVIGKSHQSPKFDYCCPVMSLPLALNINLSNIKITDPYLFSNPDKLKEWDKKLGVKHKKRIGLAWSSMSGLKDDAKRSLSLKEFLNGLPEDDKYEYICLQKELKESDKKTLSDYGRIKFYGEELKNFSDTAALIESVDLVVSTCTSIPHLSGAMGRETWILLSYSPDWRWFVNRTDSPWYPSVRLFRQPAVGNWADTLTGLKRELSKF